MAEQTRKLNDFFTEFVDKHAKPESDEKLLLEVSDKEVEELGWFFLRGLCGWIHAKNQEQEQKSKNLLSSEAAFKRANSTTFLEQS